MRAGEPWGEPVDPTEPVVAAGSTDAFLAITAARHPGALLRFRPAPTADFGRALGLTADEPGPTGGGIVLPCDLIDLGEGRTAVNAVVCGVPPAGLRVWHRLHPVRVEVDGRVVADGPATTVVVANGQFLERANLVPRGHPGDGRVEVQVYCLRPSERSVMRRRLATGEHVPHPRITQAAGTRVTVSWAGRLRPMHVDGRAVAPWEVVSMEVRPGAARVLI